MGCQSPIKKMHAAPGASKMYASLSYLAKWMLKCMLGWRGNFGPAMHMGMQNAYACPYAPLIGLSLRMVFVLGVFLRLVFELWSSCLCAKLIRGVRSLVTL
jgi:hypothetical protein